MWLVVLAGGVALISSHVPTPPEPAAPALPAADAAVHVTAGAPTQIHTLAALDGAVAAPLPAGATAATAPAAANPAEPASAATDQLQQHTALLPAGGGSPAAPAAVAALSRHKNSHNTGGPSAPGGEAAAEATATAVAGVNTAANAAQWKPSRAAAAITAAPATAAAATAAHEDMKGSGSVPATAAATGTTDVAEDVGTREAAATAARGGHRESEAADSLVGYLLALLAAAAYALHTTALKAQETLGGNFDVDLIYGCCLLSLLKLLLALLLTLLLELCLMVASLAAAAEFATVLFFTVSPPFFRILSRWLLCSLFILFVCFVGIAAVLYCVCPSITASVATVAVAAAASDSDVSERDRR